jgi:hypothetical protein
MSHDHHHSHHDDHNHDAHAPKPTHGQIGRPWMRMGIAGALIVVAFLAATLVVVAQGSAVVITRFGED